ncbi:flagellar filament capping protein FliD [uncultured Modestobacter sp.]|uniref:flagellar filament capping protein FliD n=1 Tax=uncultured Modestobacter sp. TaxID=380048 RepID=UPI002613C0FE|nr:flagellar filament capping protein FliD [uncultured Modestobacter sp.]
MAGMSVSTGLISGIDYNTMISQLMQIEANPQTLLKNKLLDTKADAAAYRAVNTTFDALRSAAEALTKSATFGAAKATSSSTDVVATAAATAKPGSQVSFSVLTLARTHTEISQGQWSSKTAPLGTDGPGWPLTITDSAGKTATVELPAGGTLTDAASAINSAGVGVTATVVQLAGDKFRLQLTSTTGGGGGVFTVAETPRTDGGTTTGFALLAQGQDATLDLGIEGLTASSATNTFTDLIPGVTFTVSKADPTGFTTVGVDSDPAAVSTAVKTMVDAANAALSAIATHTNSSTGSTAVLKGDSTLRALSNSVLSTISTAIGGASASTVGITLTRDGRLSFDAETFTAALAADPTTVQRLVNGADATTGPDGTTSPAVQGVAQRLLALAKQATNSTTGILVLKAKGEDQEASTLTSQIEDWDRRLELREASITARFNAMEVALGTLQSKSSWLSSQLGSLPSWSSGS